MDVVGDIPSLPSLPPLHSVGFRPPSVGSRSRGGGATGDGASAAEAETGGGYDNGAGGGYDGGLSGSGTVPESQAW